jgi:Zn-dependent M16 (insulinase) family peptidase
MEISKLEQGFDWLRKLLWKTHWSGERTKVVAAKMAGDIPQLKRKGSRMAFTLLKDSLYKNDSNVKTSSLVRQHKFLKSIASMKEDKLKTMFESIRNVITNPNNVTIHIAASLNKLNEQVGKTSCKSLNDLLTKTFPFSADVKAEKRQGIKILFYFISFY